MSELLLIPSCSLWIIHLASLYLSWTKHQRSCCFSNVHSPFHPMDGTTDSELFTSFLFLYYRKYSWDSASICFFFRITQDMRSTDYHDITTGETYKGHDKKLFEHYGLFVFFFVGKRKPTYKNPVKTKKIQKSQQGNNKLNNVCLFV